MNDSHASFDYDRITDQVFIGTNACCKMHFDNELITKGVTADISLEEDRVDMPFGVNTFLWLPTKDRTAPSRHNVMVGADTLDALLREGAKVFIHCQNGHGRAPTFYAAYLIVKKGFDADAAVAAVRAARPSVHLEPNQLAFLQSLRVA